MCGLMSPCKETYLNYSVIETKAMPPLGSRGGLLYVSTCITQAGLLCVVCWRSTTKTK